MEKLIPINIWNKWPKILIEIYLQISPYLLHENFITKNSKIKKIHENIFGILYKIFIYYFTKFNHQTHFN